MDEKREVGKVIPAGIEDEMKVAYLDYAMTVIVGRALPDVRDGLKPVHRRVLYAMHDLGLAPNKPHKKSARVVGEVLGKYHPHGETAVYDTLVRMAQDFSMRYPLVDGHGNFGSVDGDSAAAMRYTEARMAQISTELLADIDKETVDYRDNFDDSLQEPEVLPARLPNLLLNGSSGIAVGMATNIPPHNIREIVKAVNFLIDNPEATIDELCDIVTGPDFPTGGLLMGRADARKAYKTGHGSVTIRGVAEIEEMSGGKARIIVSELPYQVNKAALIEKIADMVRDNKLEGIQDLRDESDRDGMRIVIELKRKSRPQVVLNQLYKHTRLQLNFGFNMLALVNNQPRVLNLKQILEEYIKHQRDVITRRTRFLLSKAEERAHVLEGLRIALDYLDDVIALIRKSKDAETARKGLMEKFSLTQVQAQAILDMRLQRLTALERDKIEEEYNELRERISYYKSLLADQSLVDGVIKTELKARAEKYDDERRTRIVAQEAEIDLEDLIPSENILITLSHKGYINRMTVNSYRSQHRGGRGMRGMNTKEGDFVSDIFMANTHDYLLFFTNRGYLYRIKVYEIPESGRQGRGMALINLLPLKTEEYITAVIPIRSYKEEGAHLLMATKKGLIKKTSLQEYESKYTCLRALNLRETDELIAVRYNSSPEQEIMMVSKKGKAIRYPSGDLRAIGRSSQGVKGISLAGGDEVVGMEIVHPGEEVLTVSWEGYSKRTPVEDYRVQHRGGKGLIAARLRDKEKDGLVSFKMVKEDDEVMVVTRQGRLIRLQIKEELPRLSRNTIGVRLMRLAKGDRVVSLVRIDKDKD